MIDIENRIWGAVDTQGRVCDAVELLDGCEVCSTLLRGFEVRGY